MMQLYKNTNNNNCLVNHQVKTKFPLLLHFHKKINHNLKKFKVPSIEHLKQELALVKKSQNNEEIQTKINNVFRQFLNVVTLVAVCIASFLNDLKNDEFIDIS